jgi:hypothetical protein
MIIIIDIDLGKFKSVACSFEPDTREATYATRRANSQRDTWRHMSQSR